MRIQDEQSKQVSFFNTPTIMELGAAHEYQTSQADSDWKHCSAVRWKNQSCDGNWCLVLLTIPTKRKTASFKVNLKMNTWYDFGQGVGGWIFDLWLDIKNLDRKNGQNIKQVLAEPALFANESNIEKSFQPSERRRDFEDKPSEWFTLIKQPSLIWMNSLMALHFKTMKMAMKAVCRIRKKEHYSKQPLVQKHHPPLHPKYILR